MAERKVTYKIEKLERRPFRNLGEEFRPEDSEISVNKPDSSDDYDWFLEDKEVRILKGSPSTDSDTMGKGNCFMLIIWFWRKVNKND